ncbi:MAG: nuclear transport factor 2 family protein [Actinomycetota bacterium]
MADANGQAVERYWAALEAGDYDEAQRQLHEDLVEVWPQSGERVIGPVNWMRVIREHPTPPAFRVRRTIGREELWVAEVTFDYAPDGSARYEVCAVMECRDGKIWRLTEYFGAPFESADWRADFAERT